jgi:hypothetical protein
MTTRRGNAALDAILNNIYSDDLISYHDDIIVAPAIAAPPPVPPSTIAPIAPTHVTVLSSDRLLGSSPMTITAQGTFALPPHAVEAIQNILSYYFPHTIDARLHNFQWFLIGQGPHPRRTILIPPPTEHVVFPSENRRHDAASYLAPRSRQTTHYSTGVALENWFDVPANAPLNVIMSEDLPLPTPPRTDNETPVAGSSSTPYHYRSTNEAESSSDLARV